MFDLVCGILARRPAHRLRFGRSNNPCLERHDGRDSGRPFYWTHRFSSLAFSPDGQHIVSGPHDGVRETNVAIGEIGTDVDFTDKDPFEATLRTSAHSHVPTVLPFPLVSLSYSHHRLGFDNKTTFKLTAACDTRQPTRPNHSPFLGSPSADA